MEDKYIEKRLGSFAKSLFLMEIYYIIGKNVDNFRGGVVLLWKIDKRGINDLLLI